MKAAVHKENHPANQQPPSREAPKQTPRTTKLPSQPPKSILKNPLLPPPSASMPPTVELQNEPLTSPLYFMSPATTILEYEGLDGDHISLHDLVEAYATLSNRIRSQIRILLADDAVPPALSPLKESSSKLGAALRRDLKRAREEPSEPSSTSWNPLESSLEKEADELRVSRDNAELGHHVLRFVSEIFSFTPLSSLFSTDDLRSILDEIITLGTTSFIPSPTSNRTWTLVVWTISVQNLSPAILLPVKRQLVSVLERAVGGQMGKETAPLDGMKASLKLLKQNPTSFITPLSDIFSGILEHLIADSAVLRLQAVNALGRFALAKLETPASSRSHAALSKALTDFLTSHSARRKIQTRLRTLISIALATNNPPHPASSPFWVVQLLASVVVILKDSFFSNPAILKLTGESLRTLIGHKQNIVIGLHPHVWKCLIWTFSHLPVSADGADDAIREAAFKIVKQEMRGDIPFAFIYALLGAAPKEDSVPKVLEIVNDMFANGERRIQAEAVAVMNRLLYVPSTSSPLPFTLLAPQLFDGNLLHASPKQVISVARSIRRCSIHHIRQLTDSEVLVHWDALADLWCRAIRLCMKRELDDVTLNESHLSMAEYEENLVLHGWQTLLLMPTEMTQNQTHFTPTEGFSGNAKFTVLMCSFLADLPADPTEQLARLRLLSKMWRGMRNVFEVHRLASAAETVLGAVLKQPFDLTNADVKAEWAQFCSDLMAIGVPGAVDVVKAYDDQEVNMPLEIQRRLWASVATSARKAGATVEWKDLVYLLSIPIGVWTLSKEEEDMWETLLRAAFTTDTNILPSVVVEHVLLEVKDWRRFVQYPKHFLTLISFFNFEARATLPVEILDIVSHLLDDLYPSQAAAPTSLHIIRLVRDFFTSCPATLLVPLVVALQDSMCKWLRDQQRLLSEVSRRQVANAFFSTPLRELAKLESTIENLQLVSPLLETLADPDAFEKFWAASYHGRDELLQQCPPNLKTCLKAFTDVFGGSLAGGLSLEPHSQMESQIVHDSQLPFMTESQPQPLVESQDYFADASRYPFEDTTGMETTWPQPVVDDDHKDNDSNTSTIRRAPSRARSRPSLDPRPVSPPRDVVDSRRFSPPPPMQAASPPPTSPLRPMSPPRPAISALDQLQEYSSRRDSSDVLVSSSGFYFGSARRRTRKPASSFGDILVSSSQAASPRQSKRQNDSSDFASPAKRRKISPSPNPVAGPSRLVSESVSEPTSRMQSVILSQHAHTEPALSQKRKAKEKNGTPRFILDCVEVPTYAECRKRRRQQMESSLPTPSPSFRSRPTSTPVRAFKEEEEQEDYGSWEANLSMTDVRFVQDSLVYSVQSPAQQSDEMNVDVDEQLPHPAPKSSERRPHRTVTEPAPRTPRDPPSLRRIQTTGLDDALDRAFAAVADADSQVPMQDLILANSKLNRIGAALNEQMEKKAKKGKRKGSSSRR
ncbi:hypothetical protein C8F01DRAFT_1113489 [Mycena amicta]|nr:hypothetical protein C8F01DRAFT_1113489 [Mycena amicta]